MTGQPLEPVKASGAGRGLSAAEAPLAGIVVLDLTQVVSGPVATMLMAEFGAEVIKVEPPGGEPYRRFGRKVERDGQSINLNVLRWNRGKKSVVVNLKEDAGRQQFRQLVAQADVLVENYRPGVLERLGFGADELSEINSRLIYTTISGFGHTDLFPSPNSDVPAYAIVAEAMAGLTYLGRGRSEEPVWMGFAMSDVFAGVLAFAGVLVALRRRDLAGMSSRVDIAMHDGALFMNDMAMLLHTVFEEQKDSRGHSLQAPWGVYPCRDGHIVIAVMDRTHWHSLCRVLERDDWMADEAMDSGSHRSSICRQVIDPVLEAFTGAGTRAQVVAALAAAGVPCGPVASTAEAAESEQTAAREMLITASNRSVGPIQMVGNPIKVSGVKTDIARQVPDLDEHGDDVRRSLGPES